MWLLVYSGESQVTQASILIRVEIAGYFMCKCNVIDDFHCPSRNTVSYLDNHQSLQSVGQTKVCPVLSKGSVSDLWSHDRSTKLSHILRYWAPLVVQGSFGQSKESNWSF